MDLELLAPAKNIDVAREAILHGADAIYIGAPSHGARAAASNSIDDIATLTQEAHLYGVRVYVTINTLIYNDELRQVERTIHALYDAGVDALIVQDMGILRMDIPPIDLHASTQCDIRTPQKAKWLASLGFSQLVLPRELSLDEVRTIRHAVPEGVTLEAFVHGALCVSYSGDCQASYMANGRSANRGECAQMCRMAYDLKDKNGNVLMAQKHLLSLRDLNRQHDIEAMANAGIGSFKIEGRLKDAAYVKNTVGVYRREIDRIIDAYPDLYGRASRGEVTLNFTPDTEKAFNRGFTSYFLNGAPKHQVSMACIQTPKWIGQEVATVQCTDRGAIIARITKPINNGDGIGYFDKDGKYAGFHLNRVEGNKLYPATAVDIAPGTVLYRNRDIKFDTQMTQKTATRLLPVRMTLNADSKTVTLTMSTDTASVRVAECVESQLAKSPQSDARLKAISKLGNTIFRMESLDDQVDAQTFIPVSTLTNLRRKAVEALLKALAQGHKRRNRMPEDPASRIYTQEALTYHDNVANNLAEKLYTDHGTSIAERAVEVQKPQAKDLTVMTTRYCLRRELGACLKKPQGKNLPQPLYISNDAVTYRLDFDCKNCQMKVKSI